MARIADSEIERLKAEVSLVRLIESGGVKLARRGKDEMLGCCPFHEDDTPSLSVSVAKNLFHCFGCQASGGPIDWVMKREGVSFRHAVELLRDGAPLDTPASSSPVRATVRKLAAPVAFDADDAALLTQVIGYYHETLKQSPEALAYLASRGLSHPELIERFRLGYADRTLGLRLPEKNRKAGAEIRGRLERIGIYRESGHEHLTGSIVVPVIDAQGVVTEVYGRKIRNNLRAGTPMHLYLPGPHRGVWNLDGIMGSGGEVILAEALIDAMTFWCAGFRNVTAAYGTGGFTDDHLAAFRSAGVERVLIAFDRDEAGDKGGTQVAERLMAAGIAVFRILFPRGMDANAYAQSVTPASRSLGLLIRKAEWLGSGRAPAITSAHDPLTAVLGAGAEDRAEPSPSPVSAAEPDLAASAAPEPEAMPLPEPSIATPLPEMPAPDATETRGDGEIVLLLGDRRYRVRGWKKPLNPESLKVNLLVHRPADPEGRFHVDTLDLYAAKARAAFVRAAGIELGESEDVLKHDLGRVLLKLEECQEAEIAAALAPEDHPGMSAAERAEAMALLQSPDLMDRILADFALCGVVGEAVNIQTGYLACVSRLLDRPLAVIIQSSSAAGKSAMMDAVLAMMPADAQVRYSAMTGQSLFYMGETNLKHRILAIAEEEGASTASYALKLLQSDGEVTIASTGKDATTGNLVTQQYRVEGPVMLFLTTTAIDIDEELMNRCLVLTVDESREQTRAIHALQRRRQTLEGLLADEDRAATLALHRNAQALLESVAVVNPFADTLTFLDDKTRTRRDHMKYLTLIRAIALLHQHQRPVRTVEHRGRQLRYIEVTEADIARANGLAHEVLGRTLDELPPQTRALLSRIHRWVAAECERLAMRRSDLRFTRRQIREVTGWGDTQLKVHLSRLADLEYVLVHRMKVGQGHDYELLYDGEGEDGERFLMGLSGPGLHAPVEDAARGYDAPRSGDRETRSAPGRGVDGARSAGGRAGEIAASPLPARRSGDGASDLPESHIPVLNGSGASYPHPLAASA
ncbi:MAG: DNA primase [Microbacterium sp.]|nr:MAG: DNA primase [Microbacterium sp.]